MDARGVPLSIVVGGANVNDHKLLEATLDQVQAKRGLLVRVLQWLGISPQNLCLDKGYDYPLVRQVVPARGYVAHVRSRGEEKKTLAQGQRARRWVVEACHSWLNRFRKILVRFEKLEVSYVGLLQLACAMVCFRKAGGFG